MRIRESYAFRGELIEAWCRDLRLGVVTTKIAIAEIVGKNVNDVWQFCRAQRIRRAGETGKQDDEDFHGWRSGMKGEREEGIKSGERKEQTGMA
jgi:hypothetical protein